MVLGPKAIDSSNPHPPLLLLQANRNCLVMASTHDIQELDVSSILATQIMTWIEDEEAEAKGYESSVCSVR